MDVFTEVNLVVRLVPNVPTMAEMATAMPAAIRPYSMAVAPLSFAANVFKKLPIISFLDAVGESRPIAINSPVGRSIPVAVCDFNL